MAISCYRFYFKKDGQTFAADVIECDGDSAAVEKAKELLPLSTTFNMMGVWQGDRKVGVVERGN